jgi:hypothetical protein
MKWRTQRVHGPADNHHETPEACWMSEPFATSEQVLLCCFGLDQSAERSSAQLRRHLAEAGFRAPAARHIINSSPLIHRSSTGSFRLRRLSMEGSVP